ncbi:hypothetical protein SAMD00023353_2600260 [Rosellinia necatrix]|uniref:Uncharacterized protein n=1 Tax=Rosellinia necatrix TaxID=77044 RepID=A0A1S8A892_ROSNE|nr:hypothetical protein SAMD00023353_2600260 [Rosellinia necatrix]
MKKTPRPWLNRDSLGGLHTTQVTKHAYGETNPLEDTKLKPNCFKSSQKRGDGATVSYIESGDNRRAGVLTGLQFAAYRRPDQPDGHAPLRTGDEFRYVFIHENTVDVDYSGDGYQDAPRRVDKIKQGVDMEKGYFAWWLALWEGLLCGAKRVYS